MKRHYNLKKAKGIGLIKGIFKYSKVNMFLILLQGILILNVQNSYAATITVTNINDAGVGSLRQAILDANGDAALDVIEFNIGTGLQTIQLLTPLPIIDSDLIIDGTSQPGFVDIPLIEIDGSQQGAQNILRFDGIAVAEIKGLILNGSPGNGVFFVDCTGGNVDNCFIGISSDGTAIDGNAIDGISLINSTAIIFQNSIISGNGEDGIYMIASTGNTVKGCKIGTDITGTIDLGNLSRGVFLDDSENNTIGGDAISDRNIISGNNGHGVAILGNGNTVKGNFIGVDDSGNIGLENGLSGITVQANNNIIGTPTSGNVISGNFDRGVDFGLTSTGNILQNNIIGLNATGTAAIGNETGVLSHTNTASNNIGGEGVNEGNTISGNAFTGIFLRGQGHKVEGNRVGTDVTGDQDLGNGAAGVRLDGCNDCTVGGQVEGARNIISGNDNDGVFIENGSTNANIDGNYIGTNSSADASIPNTLSGIDIDDSDNNNIGVNSGNVISGNTGTGVKISNTASGNVLTGNFIGTDVTGFVALPNEFGVGITTNSQNNFIGGAGGMEGNLISGNLFSGISVGENSNGNKIFANKIGTNLDCTGLLPNGQVGVLIDESDNCMIGNGTEEAQNLISGNTLSGIQIQNGSDGNEVLRNYIGTDIAGTGDLGNSGSGISIINSANNIIGSPLGRNIISGNNENGIAVTQANAVNNMLQNNIVGLDINGLGALPNDGFGIVIFGSAGANQIGGLNIDEGNIVSANASSGVASAADNQTIEGNKVGTGINGNVDFGNGGSGIFLNGASNCTVVGNLISGNTLNGVLMDDGATGNQIKGNKIGTNEAGDSEIENSQHGIRLDDANANTIGGAGAGESNLISGNDSAGIRFNSSDGNKVIGNKIGTDILGEASIPNNDAIYLGTGSDNTEIGGPNPNEGNLLSGNNFDGVDINSNSGGTIIKGNIIGLNEDGTAALENGDKGIESDDSPNTIIGGTTANERNIVSGNNHWGIEMEEGDGVLIIGNFIGTNINGTEAIGNGDAGIEIDGDNVTIGGGANGEGNLISGNSDDGITTFGDNGIIQGNIIGTDITGTIAMPNADSGIDANGDNVLIGGGNVGEGNLTSGNEGVGIEYSGDDAVIQGNIVGMDINGLDPIPNESSGMYVFGNNILIGGLGANDGNLVSANLENGMDISDGSNINVEGNIIGMDINGTFPAGNFGDGINDGTLGLITIGGLVPAARNIISANGLNGISTFFAIEGEILGNFIGTDISGTQDFGNGAEGIVFLGTINYVVGGDVPGSENTIAFNAMDGVGLIDDQFFGTGFECEDIQISENSIFNNASKGINYLGNQSQVAIPMLTDVTSGASPTVQGTLNGNPNTDYHIEFFKNFNANASGNHEGKIFIGNDIVTTDGAGLGIINTILNEIVNANEIVTATARETNLNTSEFSNGVTAGALPIKLISLTAKSFEDYIQLQWVTEIEVNNKGFYIERLNDDNAWESIAFVNGKGTKTSESHYSFQDKNVQVNQTYFYRLKQEDFDGRIEYTKIVSAEIDGHVSIGEFYPNPASDYTSIKIFVEKDENGVIEIFDVVGRMVMTNEYDFEAGGVISLPVAELNTGKYSVRIIVENQVFVRNLIKSN